MKGERTQRREKKKKRYCQTLMGKKMSTEKEVKRDDEGQCQDKLSVIDNSS